MKTIISILLLIFIKQLCSQTFDEPYRYFSNDSAQFSYYLIFKENSIVEVNGYSHMSLRFSSSTPYSVRGTTLSIPIADDELFPNSSSGDTIKLTINGNLLINDRLENLYALEPKHPTITYRIDNEDFKVRSAKTDTYGLIQKHPRLNRKLKKKLESLNPKNVEPRLVYGYRAYKEFGEEYVFGIIIIR